MGYFFRKSVKLGPVRLNFSKSGVGASVGITGLRYSIRPNGGAYLNAGGHGIYYRERIGSSRSRRPPPVVHQVVAAPNLQPASAAELQKASKPELLSLINESNAWSRIDALAIAAVVLCALTAVAIHWSVSVGILVVGGLICAWIMRWERQRRAIYINYPTDETVYGVFRGIVDGFNALTNCSSVWSINSKTDVNTLTDFKRNAGASQLVGRHRVTIGSGDLPWCQVNIPIPTLQANEQSLHFLPDGILITDSTGTAHVGYEGLQIAVRPSRFIEDSAPPDATVVDYTWQHPNKSGGPDLRFRNNRQLPVCRYGEVLVATSKGPTLYLQCTKLEAAENFTAAISAAPTVLQQRLAQSPNGNLPWVAVNPERLETFPQACQRLVRTAGTGCVGAIEYLDSWLKFCAGEGNDILFQFFRVMAVIGVGVVMIGIAVWLLY